jgi:hypothetical protein
MTRLCPHCGGTLPEAGAAEAAPPPTIGLTRVQARVLDALCALTAARGHAPTYDEIARVTASSKGNVCVVVERLAHLGYVAREKRRARSLVPLFGVDRKALVMPPRAPDQVPGAGPGSQSGAGPDRSGEWPIRSHRTLADTRASTQRRIS